MAALCLELDGPIAKHAALSRITTELAGLHSNVIVVIYLDAAFYKVGITFGIV